MKPGRVIAILFFAWILAMVVGVLLNGFLNTPNSPVLGVLSGLALFGFLWGVLGISLKKS
jgi:hypothetical protein